VAHDQARIRDFARSYTAAWCSRDPARVAEHYIVFDHETVEFHWTFTGTNTGPGGTGNRVRISGFEKWTFADDGLIVRSQGHYDQDEYNRQLEPAGIAFRDPWV
jgi:hypothetical protein